MKLNRPSSRGLRPPRPQAPPKPIASRLKRQKVRRPAGNGALAPAVRQAGSLGLSLAGWGATALGLSALLLAAWAALAWSPWFQVDQALVRGTHHLSRLEVLSAAGIGSRTSLLALPVDQVERRLTELPWVRAARVTRRPPSTVIIEITERRPQLLALVEGELYLLDQDLNCFAQAQESPRPDLPVLTGLNRADLLKPDLEASELLAAVRRLLAALPPADLAPGGRLSEIRVDRVWGLSLVRGDLRPVLRLGFDNFAQRLARLKRVVADLNQRGELGRAILIDLDVRQRAVVRLGRESA